MCVCFPHNDQLGRTDFPHNALSPQCIVCTYRCVCVCVFSPQRPTRTHGFSPQYTFPTMYHRYIHMCMSSQSAQPAKANSASISSSDFPFVSGTKKNTKATPTRQTPANSQKAPNLSSASSRSSNSLVVRKAVNQLDAVAMPPARLLARTGSTSAVMTHGSGPQPSEKNAT